MQFDFFALLTFLTLVETKNFSKTAKRLGRTQSAVSQQIAKLERALGSLLITRGKPFSLTEEGELFLRYAKRIVALYQEMLDRFEEPALQGTISFGLPEDFAAILLSDVLADFAQKHPRVTLNIECDLTLNLYERFKRGEFDLVILKMSRPKEFANGQELWSEQLEWVGDTPLATSTSPLPLVLSPHPCVYRTASLEALAQVKQPWRLAFSSPSYASTIAAVQAGMGITVLPRNLIPSSLDVITIPSLPRLKETHLSLLKKDDRHQAVNSFETFVTKKLRSL